MDIYKKTSPPSKTMVFTIEQKIIENWQVYQAYTSSWHF